MLKKTFVHRGPLHYKTNRVTFSLYSADEVRELSVVKIITPLAFNVLGHPLPGGLYDPLMGPHELYGMCGTCQQSLMFCPGHFGHIELPLPVINPLFTKTLLQICRLSCLSCHAITIPPVVKHQSVAQLKLLKRGLFKEAQDAEAVMAGFIAQDDTTRKGADAFTDNEEMGKRFEAYLQEFLDAGIEDGSFTATATSTRNLENMRISVLKKVSKLAKMHKKCPLCGAVCKRMMLFESKIVYTLIESGSSRAPKARTPRPPRNMSDIDDNDDDMEDFKISAGPSQKYLTPLEARDHLRLLWLKDKEFLAAYFLVLQTTKLESPTDLLFVEVIPVPPPKNRPAQMVNNMHVEHPQNLTFRHVVSSCSVMTYTLQAIKNGQQSLSPEALRALKGINGATMQDKLETIWKELQVDVDHVMDRDKGSSGTAALQLMGLKQVIEKKEGLFRMHMMGKRVNFAARTVITPDPNIHIEEIGIPDVFAKVLTFPTPVTFWNVNHLRKMVINGPNIHPGALAVENELGQISRLNANDDAQREGIAKRLLVSDKFSKLSFKGFKIVHRHLQNGDMLLLNRQPSLHRPSIMAHRARVLHGEKVFRLHYANCKHYNADFDGDEMNAHFPQSTLARSEAANLVNVCSHFLVPKDGTPLGGLIQDHVVAAVKLTIRGRFFSRADYNQLIFFALSDYAKVFKTEPPTIIKPVQLWSGKQVISTIITNLVPDGRIAPTFYSAAKIKSDEWRQCPDRSWKAGGKLEINDLSESTVIFRKGQLLSGILDKVHLGATPYGLCHTFFELYGNAAVGALLSAFSRLMTNFLQWEGFTLGVKDVLVKRSADVLRHNFMVQATEIGHEAASLGVGATPDIAPDLLEEKLEQVHRSGDPKLRAILDQSYKQILDSSTNNINRSCLPHGLVSIFPENNLQLLVQSGAKGSTVNTMQMSCLLGQIELEGKRPPLTVAGKSLPSFKPYDTTARAGGFISARFLTGIRPQEFFFHCMAGREGLIDTAVKTSRSGYLQRCLVKLLEGVATQYDGTVRDSDGSVIQFLYGEDGLDVCKSQYLKSKMLEFLHDNAEGVLNQELVDKIRTLGRQNEIKDAKQKLEEWLACNNHKKRSNRESEFLNYSVTLKNVITHSNEFNRDTGRSTLTEAIIQQWYNFKSTETKRRKERNNKLYERCPDPLVSIFQPDANYGVVSETLESMVEKYLSSKGWSAYLKDLVYYKAMRAQSSPGDAVGVLAAQSIGEPSTQMTLNTFHFAGRGEMNVTLGIPRLREILMVASANIRTPSMDIPFLSKVTEDEAEDLRLRLTRATLTQVLQEVHVTEKIDLTSRSRVYILKFIFLSESEYNDRFWIKPTHILRYVEKVFFKHRLIPSIRRAGKIKRGPSVASKDRKAKGRFGNGENDQDDMDGNPSRTNYFEESEKKGGGEGHLSSDEDPEVEDEDATQQTRRARQTEAEYDAPEEEERFEDPGDVPDLETEEPADTEQNESEMKEVDETEFRISLDSHETRVATVVDLDDFILDYEFDRIKEEHCTVTLKVPLSTEKMNLGSILKEEGAKAVIHQVANINRAFVTTVGEKLSLKTEGINILAMAQYPNLLDLNKLHCNNIHTMAEHYGIEAASKVIVKEMSDVFKAYGITLDLRHLTLLADYMTFSGTYRPFNRIGIESSSSPLQQMSFETVVSFLKDATLSGRSDELTNPSARLVLGKPPRVGTGIFDLRQKLSNSDD